VESDVELARWAGDLIGPLLLAGAAAFSYLALLAWEHLKIRALVELLRAAAARRRRGEGAPERLRGLEEGLRRILEREGVREGNQRV
jgi:hypothetical protein